MSAGEFLDQLDALHAAATTGPWELDREALLASNDTGDLLFDYRDVVLVEDHPEGIAGCAADGELIVVAVNTLPQLTAAVRQVLAYCDEMDRADFFPGLASTDAIRTRITSALSPADPMSAEPGMSQP